MTSVDRAEVRAIIKFSLDHWKDAYRNVQDDAHYCIAWIPNMCVGFFNGTSGSDGRSSLVDDKNRG